MYRVVKEIGNTENVFLRNTETMAEINLGRATMEMMGIIEEDGLHKFSLLHPSDDLAECVMTKDKWNFDVTESTKEKLRKLAMPMKKPIRDQRKNKEDKPKKEIVDVLDIIYGLA